MDKDSLFRIGDVARLFHISVGTLRHYEKNGLLAPEYIDPGSGYRYYSIRQFECLHTIRALRALDMSLPQIASFLQNREIPAMEHMLQEQLDAVIQKQEELNRIERKIRRRIEMLQDAVSSELNVIRIQTVPAQRAVWMKRSLTLHSYLDLETSIRQLDKSQTETAVWLGKVGVGISPEHLNTGNFEHYDCVFLLLDPEDPSVPGTDKWQETTCVVVRFRGSHQEAPAQYRTLLQFIRDHSLSITGFSREITRIDNGMTNDPNQFVTEIQIPIAY